MIYFAVKSYYCAPPPHLVNGIIKESYKEGFPHGKSVSYVCAKGYRLDGNKIINCYDGKWSQSTAICGKILTDYLLNSCNFSNVIIQYRTI